MSVHTRIARDFIRIARDQYRAKHVDNAFSCLRAARQRLQIAGAERRIRAREDGAAELLEEIRCSEALRG